MAPPRDPDPFADLTIALRNLSASGEATSPEHLRAIVTELRAVARSHLGSQRASHTLQPTALVNEAFLKLFGSRSLETIHDRQHFFALASRIMRQILVDHARQRSAGKRGADSARSTLIDAPDAMSASDEDVLDVNAALVELAERRARVAFGLQRISSMRRRRACARNGDRQENSTGGAGSRHPSLRALGRRILAPALSRRDRHAGQQAAQPWYVNAVQVMAVVPMPQPQAFQFWNE